MNEDLLNLHFIFTVSPASGSEEQAAHTSVCKAEGQTLQHLQLCALPRQHVCDLFWLTLHCTPWLTRQVARFSFSPSFLTASFLPWPTWMRPAVVTQVIITRLTGYGGFQHYVAKRECVWWKALKEVLNSTLSSWLLLKQCWAGEGAQPFRTLRAHMQTWVQNFSTMERAGAPC